MKWNPLSYRKDGAGDGTRTRDVQLGKLAFFRWPGKKGGFRNYSSVPGLLSRKVNWASLDFLRLSVKMTW